jgi:hypothetical protein
MTELLQPAAATAHERHDPELIAALAARKPDLSARDLDRARELVQRCSGCRDLLADLTALQVALPTTSTPTRRRDFTLTTADADRLHRRGWRRAIGFFGSSRDGFSRPLAVGFTTIGLAALLFTAISNVPFATGGAVLSTVGSPVGVGAGAAAPAPAASAAPTIGANAAAAGASAAAPLPSAAPVPAASSLAERQSLTAEPYATDGDQGGVFSGSNDTDTQSEEGGTPPDEVSGDSGLLSLPGDDGLPLGVAIGGISLIIGLGLFALRWTSRRLGYG